MIRPPKLSRIPIYMALVLGAILFAFPFLDMVCTSIKLDDEMATQDYRLLPKTPHAQWASPYVDTDVDPVIKRPADMPKALWKDFEAPFTAAIRAQVANWWDAQPFIPTHYSQVARQQALDTLTQTVGQRVLSRIPDTARQQGAAAMLKETGTLCDHETIFPVFQMYVPRLALGNVRVRHSDFATQTLGRAADWRVIAGPASLRLSDAPLDRGAQVGLHFTDSGQSATFRLVPTTNGSNAEAAESAETTGLRTQDSGLRAGAGTGPARSSAGPAQPSVLSPQFSPASASSAVSALKPAPIDRVYLSYLPDRSWSRLEVFIQRNGIRYKMAEPLYCDDVRWNELELRWPDPEQDKLAGRSYRLLEEDAERSGASGQRPVLDTPLTPNPYPLTPSFTVEVRVSPTSALGTWWAKATRNYYTAFRQVPITRYIMTSVSLAILNIVLVVFGSSFAAYAFARLDFPGRDFLFGVLLATMMIPGQVTMIPTFLIYKNLGWYNTLLPLWLPSAFGSAFFIFMARQFLKSIPRELEEAARIDGCGFLRIYWYIMLPLIRPTLAAIAMFAFQGAWNNFMGPLIYVNDERMFNLAFGLFKFQLISGSSNSLMMAGAFVMTLPLIITFFLFQRYFVQGIALSGLGGR